MTVSASDNSGSFTYIATSGAKIITYDSGSLSSPTFNLPITQEFTPQATLVVYAVVGGELLADSIQFNVEGAFQNEVSGYWHFNTQITKTLCITLCTLINSTQ